MLIIEIGSCDVNWGSRKCNGVIQLKFEESRTRKLTMQAPFLVQRLENQKSYIQKRGQCCPSSSRDREFTLPLPFCSSMLSVVAAYTTLGKATLLNFVGLNAHFNWNYLSEKSIHLLLGHDSKVGSRLSPQ